ncbi:protein kinase [Streptacidiphilus sp. MAP5-52]|uniref:protein kinase domain-containing protein n=1 Tax=Streptacidiphilus sp. MAP5-52 TaxID=3156267 RepID=UPI003514B32D
MKLDPMHPAAWVLDHVTDSGFHVHDLLAFTRASTLLTASRPGSDMVVLKAGFGSNHVLAQMDPDSRPAAYGFYWYAQMTEAERALTRQDFRYERDTTLAASGTPHVAALLEHGDGDHFDWYTMPLADGGNFRTFMVSPQAADHARGLAILADVATGLHALHQHGIVHRDVYQENILIHDGVGMITDLGAARRGTAARGPASRSPEVHWPPEYATTYDRATPAADVYSLAVLVHRYLCGDIPRLGPAELPDVPAALRPVLAASLATDPAQRPDMAALRDALRTAADR